MHGATIEMHDDDNNGYDYYNVPGRNNIHALAKLILGFLC